jgi:hypothetical protein
MRYPLLALPFAALWVAGCVQSGPAPQAYAATIVAPPPARISTFVTPGAYADRPDYTTSAHGSGY